MNALLLLLVAVALVAGVLVWRRRKTPAAAAPAPAPAADAPKPTWKARAIALLRQLAGRWQHLLPLLLPTPAARYAQPWVLLLGEARAGKSSLIASLARVRDHEDAQGRPVPGVPMTAWHTLPQGMLIDPDGRATAAASGTPPAPEWQQLLRGLSAQRPERALDGVLLVVSARSLRDLAPLARLQLAQDARRQLQDLRSELGVVLPVYLVVTQCDGIDGFGSFWRAIPASLTTQMQGWAAAGGLHQAPPGEWLDTAWTELVERLQTLQVDAASLQARVPEADAFFLYPRQFAALRPRLREYVDEVFQDTAWDRAFLCRGVWFTGVVPAPATPPQGVRADVGFVDQLVAEKVLRERGLARVTERTVWSRDTRLRVLQQAAVACALVATVALALASVRLDRQVDGLARGLVQQRQEQPVAVSAEACVPKSAVDEALRKAAALDPYLVQLTMPLSWFDRRPTDRVVRAVSGTVMAKTVFPAIACGLQQRAARLASALPLPAQTALAGIPVQGSDYARIRSTLLLQAGAVRGLEENFRRFDRLWAVPADGPTVRIATLNQLSLYLYGEALPAAALAGQGSIPGAVASVEFPRPPPLPTRLRTAFAQQLQAQTAQLRAALLNEVAAGPKLLARLNAGTAPVSANATWFAAWLTWVSKSWLPSDPEHNPCAGDRRELEALLRPLVDSFQYPATLLSALPSFGRETCQQPAFGILQAMQMAPYGPLVITRDQRLVLNPELNAEVGGFTALLGQGYMQVANPQPFACIKSAPGWRTVDIGRAEFFAREYQQFAAAQSLAPLGTAPTRRPLYQRVAAQQLELVMNDALRAAQASAGAPEILHGLSAVSAADQQMLEQSTGFARSLQPLLATLRLYTQLGFGRSGSLVAQCARDFSSDALGRVSALANQSRVYEPPAGGADGALVSIGPLPVVRDYLARQVSRAQVLITYADPFATLMRNTDGVNDAQRAGLQTLGYWSSTISELNRFVQFKEPAGQVANIETLFLKTVPELTYANCSKILAEYRPPDYGQDLFSDRRRSLVQWLRSLCKDRVTTVASEAYERVAERFNMELAGRYPFGPMDAQEAALGTAKAFFVDYDAQRASLDAALASLDRRQWQQQLAFIAQLDKAAAFLRGSLTATPASQPLRLAPNFRPRPPPGRTDSGSNQVVGWALGAGSRTVSFPGASAPVLDWPFGEAIDLQLAWADRSIWRPVGTPDRGGLVVDGATASFSSGGDWALLRMIERFRTPGTGDGGGVLLEFVVPVVRADAPRGTPPSGQAQLFLGIELSLAGKTPVAWPGPFPRIAPAVPAPATVAAARSTR